MAAKKKTTAKATRKKATPRKAETLDSKHNKIAAQHRKLDKLTVDLITNTAKDIHKDIIKKSKPTCKTMPPRSAAHHSPCPSRTIQ